MSIYGIRGPIIGTTPGTNAPGAPGTQVPNGPGRTDRRTGVAPGAVKAPVAAERPGASSAAVPAQPPPGTDPELWSVLSSDERTYFAKLGAMGPLTYGRVLSGQVQPQQVVSRGARLDVKA